MGAGGLSTGGARSWRQRRAAAYRPGVDAAGVIERRVRAAVRDRGIDPLREPAAVRAIVDDALADLVADWATADASAVDPADVAQRAFDAVAGFGPLQRLFDDPRVEEIWVNAPDRIFCARNGVSELTTIVLDARQVRDLVERMLRVSGRRLDLSSPFVDAMLPDGSRLHVVIPDVTREHWVVNIRRFVVQARSISDLCALGAITPAAAAFLDAAVVSGLNILISGSTHTGKTTLLNALLGCVPAHERIVSCEEVFEVRLDHADAVSLQTRDAGIEGRGAITVRRLVREALRMRPTRLVVGEVRGEESLDLLVAMNSGLPAMATIHANSAREAVTKLCTLPLLAGPNVVAGFIVPTVAASVDLVVHLGLAADGRRAVREIAGVGGRVEAGIIELSTVYAEGDAGLRRADGHPPHADRFARSGFDLVALLERS